MREYTVATIISSLGVILLDRLMGTQLTSKKKFWYFQLLVVFLASIVDNIISGRPYVYFNESHMLGLRVGYVPVENFFFGFSLITLNLILFEYKKRKTA